MPAAITTDSISGSSGGGYLERFKSDSKLVIKFKLVKFKEDINDDEVGFNPEYTHQLYGESESIFGYAGLRINLYYSTGKLITYLDYKYDEKMDARASGGVKPDEPLQPILENISHSYCTNLDDFEKQLDEEKDFQPFGSMINKFSLNDKDGLEHVYEVYTGDVLTPGLLEYHERLQTFILFFIDGASYIDTDDDKWKFYFLFEKFLDNGHHRYSVVGYSTAYNYYAYPANVRPRISQLLVLPPYQGVGLGAKLLQTMYNDMIGSRGQKILDITVEDPVEEFQRLRDFVDCRNCMKLECFNKEKVMEGFTEEMSDEVNRKLKLNKKQIRRVYEIVRLHHTNQANDRDMKRYRLDVKRRLNAPYQKKEAEEKRLKKYFKSEELAETIGLLDANERHTQLELMYNELLENYMRVVKRLDNIVDLS